jgi:hypothetical protein
MDTEKCRMINMLFGKIYCKKAMPAPKVSNVPECLPDLSNKYRLLCF